MEKDVGRMNSSVGWNANGYGDLDALELMQFFGGGGGIFCRDSSLQFEGIQFSCFYMVENSPEEFRVRFKVNYILSRLRCFPFSESILNELYNW